MLYGYTALARELNERLTVEPPLKKQNVDMWYKRQVVNHAGQVFPPPALIMPKTARTGRAVRFQWELEPVIAWCLEGIPAYPGNGWRFPQPRNNKSTQLVTH